MIKRIMDNFVIKYQKCHNIFFRDRKSVNNYLSECILVICTSKSILDNATRMSDRYFAI